MPTMPKTIQVPRLSVKTGIRKDRAVTCEIYTEDGRVPFVDLKLGVGTIDDDVKRASFLVDADNQFEGEDGYYHQILGERSPIPVCMRAPSRVSDLKALILQIHRDTKQQTKANQFEERNKDDKFPKVMWLISVPCGLFALIYIIQHFW